MQGKPTNARAAWVFAVLGLVSLGFATCSLNRDDPTTATPPISLGDPNAGGFCRSDSDCASASSGPKCVSGLCGCAADGECGNATSGKICATTTTPPSCQPGCRVDGGNGCAAPQVCMSGNCMMPGG